MHIVDRRLNPGGKNLSNRQRFIRRAKEQIRKAVHEASAGKGIRDADEGGEVVLPASGVHEPRLHRSSAGGIRDHLLPGNKDFVVGDTIPGPRAAAEAADRRAARMAKARMISASRCRGTSSSTCSWRTWNCPTWPSAGSPAPRR